jgi:hypothetical protein
MTAFYGFCAGVVATLAVEAALLRGLGWLVKIGGRP